MKAAALDPRVLCSCSSRFSRVIDSLFPLDTPEASPTSSVFTTHSTVWTYSCRRGEEGEGGRRDSPNQKKNPIKSLIRSKIVFSNRGRQMPVSPALSLSPSRTVIAAIESKCFDICIFFYNLDIWSFLCLRACDIRFPRLSTVMNSSSSLLFSSLLSSFVVCVCVCAFLFSLCCLVVSVCI